MPEMNNLKKERFILAYSFKGLIHGWLTPLLLGPQQSRNIMQKDKVEERCSPYHRQEVEREQGRGRDKIYHSRTSRQ
jgi:hypothetical protein